jgi:uncharacterized protein involved in exopolysaccharide biosynthesis
VKEDVAITPVDLVRFVRHHLKLLGPGLLIGALLAAAVAFLTTPIYRATVVLTPVDTAESRGALSRLMGQFGGLASLAGVSIGGSQSKDEAIAILKSEAFSAGIIEEARLLPIFFPKHWDARRSQFQADDPDDVPTMADALEVFDKRVRSVIEDRDRGLISVRIEWRDRELAARLANLIATRINEQMRTRRIAELDKNIQYLRQTLQETDSLELRQAAYSLVEAQLNERMMANGREEFAFRVVDPARVPDADRYIRPRRALLIAIGAMAGLLAAGLFAALRVIRSARVGD